MIFYFSGTGNSRFIAEELARLTGDKAYDIITLDSTFDWKSITKVGFVFPIHAWGVPEVMLDFIKKTPKISGFSYGVCTCGGDAGIAMHKLKQIYPLSSCYSIIMPNNYILGSDTEDLSIITKKLNEARGELSLIASEIKAEKSLYRVKEGKLASLKSNLANWGFNRFARSAKAFRVNNSCNGCRLCAQRCPDQAITIVNSKPVWADRCFKCTRCINECPKEAIQYGKKTISRKRYCLQKYL